MLDKNEIFKLLKSTEIIYQRIGCDMIFGDFKANYNLFFNHVIEGGDIEKILSDAADNKFFFLKRYCSDEILFDYNKKYALFDDVAEEHRLFLDCLNAYLKKIDNPIEYCSKLLSIFPRLKPYLPHPLTAGIIEKRQKRQLMLFITGLCNLNCPYCFSENISRREMDFKKLEEIVGWCCNNDIRNISLCGGEPLMYSHFDKMLNLFCKDGIKIYFASNMTWEVSDDCFNGDVISKIYAHITKTTLDNQKLKEIFFKNVSSAKKKGIEVLLRVNIYDGNKDAKRWIDIAKELNINKLNIALTFPTKERNNNFVDIGDISAYSDTLINFYELAKNENITLDIAKPLPLCCFDDDIARILLKECPGSTYCSIFENDCTYNVTITNDGYFNQCLGLTKKKMPFSKTMSWDEVVEFCSDVKELINKPLMNKCSGCYLFDAKICQGSCLSYK